MTLDRIAVDANPLLAALLGARAAEILSLPEIDFVTTERTIWEVRKYLPRMARKLGISEEELLAVLEASPIRTIHPSHYARAQAMAAAAVSARDPRDVEILAPALSMDIPLGSNDRDFQSISELTLLATSELADSLLPKTTPPTS
jgi:predicted nucleic acid-binding protein